MGVLPNGHKLKISYKGKSLYVIKDDVGEGGPNHPKIDLHITLAKALEFYLKKGLDEIEIEDA